MGRYQSVRRAGSVRGFSLPAHTAAPHVVEVSYDDDISVYVTWEEPPPLPPGAARVRVVSWGPDNPETFNGVSEITIETMEGAAGEAADGTHNYWIEVSYVDEDGTPLSTVERTGPWSVTK